jgi:PAS domain S-box-containing protein
MNEPSQISTNGIDSLEVLWKDGERVFCRKRRLEADGRVCDVLVVTLAAEHPTPADLDRLAHEYALKDELDGPWAVRPLALIRERGRTMLVLEDPASEPLNRQFDAPMELGRFLRVAIAIAAALVQLHRRGLVHKDLKPTNILVNAAGEVIFTGFGIASRLSRERLALEPPETIAGTLAYMAPEQTGRMNRSIDSRSDLYAVGVTLYEMLTGALPFTAADPMEWVHCHVARRPTPPAERVKDVPGVVSAIVMKLLAKTAEERYQTAAGLKSDLQRCLAASKAQSRIEYFRLGEHDKLDRLIIPEKLYGREREIKTLLASFDRIVRGGPPELVLVSGHSGIGKSSVVNELHKVLVPPRGLFASGKFDQYKRDIPYATLAQAFQSLVRSLLSKSEAELRIWRDASQEALGPNALLIVDIIPELKLIIGEQPPVPILPPRDAQRRFQLVFRRFIGVFARPEHPLALFLDDLQWLDAATLDLLEDLLTQSDVRHLMLIGAYRDNEVDSDHALMRKLETIRKNGAAVQEIVLAPLVRKDLERLIGDSLRCEPNRTAPLTQLVYEKTIGNPFFAIQFISSLAEERLLTFDHGASRWSWELAQIHAKGYTDNVVDLMVGKLSRLPVETQYALQQLACLGNNAEFTLLMTVYQETQEEMHHKLWEAVRAGLVFRSEASYKFLHDRVQEAAYSLIAEQSRAEAHLRIGRLLVTHILPEQREEAIFDIVNHLNRGTTMIASREEREHVAELNLIAGKRAKASTAYTSALRYLIAAGALLADDAWERKRDLIFTLELHRAECELLSGQLTAAADRLTMLSSRAANAIELASITCLQADLYTLLDQSDRAVAVCLNYLRHVGVEWSPHPTYEDVQQEYDRIWSLLGRRAIDTLTELPLMSDTASLSTMDVLTKVMSAAYFTDENLSSLVICHMVNLSLEHGNSDGSCFAYVWLAVISGPRFNNYQDGFRFGRLGYELVEEHGLKRFQARTYMCFGNMVMPWAKHVQAGRSLVRRAFDTANEIGDLTFAAYSCNHLVTNLLAAGDQLAQVQYEAEKGLEFARKLGFGLIVDDITAQLRLVLSLRGLTTKFGIFNDERFDELQFEQHLSSGLVVAEAECWYSIRKLQARFFAGDYASAVDASLRAKPLLWTSPSQFETVEFHFYGALSHAACWDFAPLDRRQQHFEAQTNHHLQLRLWEENCSENFESRAALVGAEIARIEGRELDAERLYEQAIHSARTNGFIHNEALAYELAANSYAARGFEEFAQLYLRKARDAYVRWGADGKVRQLDETHPYLREKEPILGPTSTIGTPVEYLDLLTVLKVSEAVSGEIVFEKLIDTLLRTALEHAGAERGLLILSQGSELRIRAEATTGDDSVRVDLCDTPVSGAEVPESLILYAARTLESVILDDASTSEAFKNDAYIHGKRPRSVLGLPLIKQGKSVALLYLENNLAPHVFTPARVAMLKFLASEAATSLDNARLYHALRERESRIRRLVDANIIGICIFGPGGDIVEANHSFLKTVGYDREDIDTGRLRWTNLTPPEWSDRNARAHAELAATGAFQPFEKEYFRKDGSRAPILIGAAAFDEQQAVAFVLDLSERKRAEAEAFESEQRYREAQRELAHANRVAVMGLLTASIAHEVSQPTTAVVASAQAALHWLDRLPPQLDQVREALVRTVQNGSRASEVIERIRDLVKKKPPRKDFLAINATIGEVIDLIQAEAARSSVSVKTAFTDGLPEVVGDRVELQQVAVNLTLNAIEAMSATTEGPRELLIRTAMADGDGVLVSVMDSGPGLSPASLERVFDPFYTTKPGGLGIGLSVCRSIIEAYGGRLWVNANQPRGAVFQFTVPAKGGGSI